ncbi:MAG: hypothetical protein AAFX96_01150 [Pseudomonadota bacterium]
MRFAPVLRSFDLVMIVVLLAVVAWTFKVKHDSQRALDDVAALQQQINNEKNEIDLLNSDWSLLTSPARLQELVERYGGQLGLQPVEPAQLADEAGLPPIREELLPQQIIKEDFANVDRDITTGGIGGAAQ